MNEKINELYNKIEAQDKIINEQALEIADLKHQITLMNEDMRTGLEIKKELEAEIKSLNDSNIWWQNRFNAVERDNRKLKERIDKAIEYIKDLYDVRFTDKDKRKLLEILGDKE